MILLKLADLSKTKVYSKFVSYILRNEQKSTRANHSKDVVTIARNDPNFLKSIVTCDETWCFQHVPKTKCKSVE